MVPQFPQERAMSYSFCEGLRKYLTFLGRSMYCDLREAPFWVCSPRGMFFSVITGEALFFLVGSGSNILEALGGRREESSW